MTFDRASCTDNRRVRLLDHRRAPHHAAIMNGVYKLMLPPSMNNKQCKVFPHRFKEMGGSGGLLHRTHGGVGLSFDFMGPHHRVAYEAGHSSPCKAFRR